jgi:hypothetical protein
MRAVRLSIGAGAIFALFVAGHSEVGTERAARRMPRAIEWPIVVIGGSEVVLDCSERSAAELHVAFACDSVTIYSCSAMSKAVLEYEGGKRQRFADLHGQVVTLAGQGKLDASRILSVWVPDERATAKTTADASGAGQRFEAPEDSCASRHAAIVRGAAPDSPG